MTEESVTPRSRFQFRLRTLMIVVTLMAIPLSYLGYVGRQVKIVRERKAILETIKKAGGQYFVVEPMSDRRTLGHTLMFHIVKRFNANAIAQRDPQPSMVRAWLGDVNVQSIYVPDSSIALEIVRCFPEAYISQVPAEFLAESLHTASRFPGPPWLVHDPATHE